MRRQMKKLMEQSKPPEEIDEDLIKQVHTVEQQKKQKQVFQMMEMSDSDNEVDVKKDEEVQTSETNLNTATTANQKKQKKKKNKKKNQQKDNNKDDDFEFLDSLQTQQQQQQQQIQQYQESQEDGPLAINIKRLNYNKELQQHFKNAKLAGGQQNKKNKNQKQYYLTYNPDISIPLPDKFNVKFGGLNEQGLQLFTLEASQAYERLQQDYSIVKGYYDPQAIFNFLQMNPYHCEAQFDVSEYFRLKGDYKQANELLERLLYIYENSLGYGFHKFFEDATVNLEIEENAHSKVFLMSLFKFTDVLSRKGCYKAALEFSKILLKFSPTRDPCGALLLLDCNSIKAQQYEYLIKFTTNFGRSVYKTQRASLAFMPNFIYNCALAKFLMLGENPTYIFKEEHVTEALHNYGSDPLNAPHQVLIIQAILLYPIILKQLADANEFTKQNVGNLDCFKDFQRKTFKELLSEEFLTRETYLHWFLQMDQESDTDGFLKIVSIFIEKNRTQWKTADVLKWLKGALGMIINQIKNGTLDLGKMYEDLSVLSEGQTVYNEIPFSFRRYKDLSKSHFLENPERLDFNNIFAENIGAQQQQQQQMPANFNPLNANHGLLQAVFGTLLPWVHHPNAQQ